MSLEIAIMTAALNGDHPYVCFILKSVFEFLNQRLKAALMAFCRIPCTIRRVIIADISNTLEKKMAALQYSRDQNRVPMQWDGGENAGFTTGKAWLPINPNHTEINVAAQQADPHSVLSYYKRLVKARKESAVADALSLGDFDPVLLEDSDVIAYMRVAETSRALVINNYRKAEHTVTLPCIPKGVVLSNYNEVAVDGVALTLHPYQAVIFEI